MSDQEPNEGVGSLFFELAGNLRLLMLTKLSQKTHRLSQLATELNATMQEAHRNMTRLIDAGLVAKGREGELMLTVYGKTVVMLVPSYDFLYRNKDFFLDHRLGDLPTKFIQRMGTFQGCEIVHGVMAILERWMLPEVKVMTIFNEKQGCVLFPNMKGEPDLNIMFYSEDKEFLEWCFDLFAYQWEKAGPFDENKLKNEI